MLKYSRITSVLIILAAFLLQSCSTINSKLITTETTAMHNVIPKPFFTETTGGYFRIEDKLYIHPGTGTEHIGKKLADILTSLNYPVTVLNEYSTIEDDGSTPAISINIDKKDISLGKEGYVLKVKTGLIELAAYDPEGAFRGVQTLRQMLPVKAETGDWSIPCGVIRDHPRFEWRGTMLDVARHFFTVDEVKRYIDQAALYKINRLHLHLSDDQGWRIEIKSWPNLTKIGGNSSVNNEKPGFYSQEEYSDIIKYAEERYITVVPEIDMPGHTNAALASYPELNCNDSAQKIFTGTEVGFSSLCIKKEITYKFINDVLEELSALTPGKYLHVGGDEAHSTDSAEYVYFIERVQDIVNSKGKYMVGWEETAQAKVNKTTIAQLWRNDMSVNAAKSGSKVILSPSWLIYLDMKYNASTEIGQDWAALVEVDKAYNWEPSNYLSGLSENDILGIEAPLWSETIKNSQGLEFLAFPRLIGAAELGWSTKPNRNWEDYKKRLGSHKSLLESMGINFYRSPLIDWK